MRISDWSSDVCSSDLDVAAGDPRGRVIEQGTNRGKGAALRRGFAEATAEIVIVQDADLEYDPGEFGTVVGPIVAGAADVVFGSRFTSGGPHRVLYYSPYLGNRLLPTLSHAFINLNLTDMENLYKTYRRARIPWLDTEEVRFAFG